MNVATKSVEFSFNNVTLLTYKQIGLYVEWLLDSPLRPALANIFVGYYENNVLTSIEKPFLQYILVTLMIRLLFSDQKPKETNFFRPQLTRLKFDTYNR